MITKQLSVFLENRTGQLCEITAIIAENGIDIKALNIAETSDYGIIRLIVDDERKAAQVLSSNDYIVSVCDVEMVAVPNKPGGLATLLKKIYDANVGIEYMYSIFAGDSENAQMVFKTENPGEIEKLL